MTRTQGRFGDLARSARKAAKLTMAEVAAKLDISVVYVSDLERGNRPPFKAELIDRLATVLQTDATALHRAAAESRGAFKVNAQTVPPPARDFVAGLARGEKYSDSFWEELVALAAKDRKQGHK